MKIKTDELSMRSNMNDNIWLIKWLDLLSPQWSRQAVITVSRHDLEDHKIKMESPPIFSVRVWSVTRGTCS